MASRLIELQDGFLVEVEAAEDQPQQIAASVADRVEGALDDVQALLQRAVKPVTAVWDELNRDLTISQVEINLALGFAAEGNLFIARGTGNANVSFRSLSRVLVNNQSASPFAAGWTLDGLERLSPHG